VKEKLIGLLQLNEEGLSDEILKLHFSNEELVPVINDMLKVNRLQLYVQGSGLVYKLVNESRAVKLEGLG